MLLNMTRFISCAAIVFCLENPVSAEVHDFYVGLDTRDQITFGTYLGLDNPNKGRLTFLFAHPNEGNPETSHFHGIGVHSYEGPVDSAVATTTNGNNRIPETYTGQAPLTLLPGTGSYTGKLVSRANEEHYSDLTIHNVHDLSGFAPDATETYLYNSSAMGYQGSLDGVDLALEIVSITPGLKLGAAGLGAGETLPIGGTNALPFEPVFWTEADVPAGDYSAELRLVDQSGNLASSGTFHIDFAVSRVPEASSFTILGLALLGAVVVRCRA